MARQAARAQRWRVTPVLGHNAGMLIVALDTTTRAGSHAVVRDGEVLALGVGNGSLAQAERLPGDVVSLITGCGFRLSDVDLFAVAAGPGSFTGLRIGIAAMQGLAFAVERPIVGVSALEALATATIPSVPAACAMIGVWMDGQRGEVFAALFGVRRDAQTSVTLQSEDAPFVASPAEAVARWAAHGVQGAAFVGDGALRYREILAAAKGLAAAVADPVPHMAPAIAALAVQRLREGGTFHPHAIVPLYVRRPDVELARDRQASRHA